MGVELVKSGLTHIATIALMAPTPAIWDMPLDGATDDARKVSQTIVSGDAMNQFGGGGRKDDGHCGIVERRGPHTAYCLLATVWCICVAVTSSCLRHMSDTGRNDSKINDTTIEGSRKFHAGQILNFRQSQVEEVSGKQVPIHN